MDYMSLASKKKPWNTKKNGTKMTKMKKPPPAIPLDDVTVRDCLVWNSPEGKKGVNPPPGETFVYRSVLVKRDRTADEGGDSEENQRPDIQRKIIPEEGTVGDAIRGWQQYRVSQGQQNDGNISEWNGYKYNDDDLIPEIFKDQPKPKPAASQRMTKKSATSGDKRHTRKGPSLEDTEDAAMGDLMSQRFHREYLAQLEEEQAKEKRRRELKAQAAAEGRRAARDRTDIKANRTSQLRAIALAEKVETSPMDLWKMGKFKNVPAHLSTFRTGRSGGAGGRKNNECDDDGEHAPCTCDNGQPVYDDEDDLGEMGGGPGGDDEIIGSSSYLYAL